MGCSSSSQDMFSDAAMRELKREYEIAERARLHGWMYDRYAHTAEIIFHRDSVNPAANTETIKSWTWEGIEQLLDADHAPEAI